jgi:hypothetical protein
MYETPPQLFWIAIADPDRTTKPAVQFTVSSRGRTGCTAVPWK